MKILSFHPSHSAKALFASLYVLSAGACLAATPAGEPSPSPAAEPTHDRRVIIVTGETNAKFKPNSGFDGFSGTPSIQLEVPRELFANVWASDDDTAKAKVWCGVSLSEVSAESRAQLTLEDGVGVLVRDVTTDGPAKKAGLQANDILTKFDGEKITDPAQFKDLVNAKKEGDKVRLGYLRRGREATAEVTLSRPSGEATASGRQGLSSIIVKALAGAQDNFTATSDGHGVQVIVLDKAGKVVPASKDGKLGEALTDLEKSLHDAGVAQEVIDRTRKEVADAIDKANAHSKETPDHEVK